MILGVRGRNRRAGKAPADLLPLLGVRRRLSVEDCIEKELFGEMFLPLQAELVTEPLGADVHYRPYTAPEANWTYVGATPLENVRLRLQVAEIESQSTPLTDQFFEYRRVGSRHWRKL